MVLPPILIFTVTSLMMAINIRVALLNRRRQASLNRGMVSSVAIETREMESALRQHRHQKISGLKGTLPPLILLLLAACITSKSHPWQKSLWLHSPSAIGFGLNVAYWGTEIAMDTALDECGALKLWPATFFTALLQCILIVALTTEPLGHIVFWLKATEVLLATAMARLIDHVYWIVIAAMASCFVAGMAATKQLAPLPPNVKVQAAVAYFVATVLPSTAYQLLQNSLWTKAVAMANIKMIRAGLCCLAMWAWDTPPSWIIYDAVNFALFFGIKIVMDTIAIRALRSVELQ